MTTEIEFAKAIEIIATDLGVVANRIFEIFVSAQAMIGIIQMGIVTVAAMSAYLVGKYVRERCLINYKDEDGNWNHGSDAVDAVVYPMLAALVAIVLVCCLWLPSAMACLRSPTRSTQQ